MARSSNSRMFRCSYVTGAGYDLEVSSSQCRLDESSSKKRGGSASYPTLPQPPALPLPVFCSRHWLLGLITPNLLPFATFYPASMIATLVGGMTAGVIAVGLGAVIGFWLLMPEFTAMPLPVQLLNFVLYLASSLVVVWAGEQYRALVRHLDQEEQFRQVLVSELGHRVHNKLATIQAILRHELRAHREVAHSVSRRLAALAATDEFLANSDGEDVELEQVVRAEPAPYDETRAVVEGTPTQVPPRLAVTLALILHELATNAAKHGALSTSDSRVLVSWRTAAGRTAIEVECGDPPISPPTRRGFGQRLIEEGLTAFGGEVEVRFEPGGLHCILSFPLEQD
jgi:two-component sensor histidine kinase